MVRQSPPTGATARKTNRFWSFDATLFGYCGVFVDDNRRKLTIERMQTVSTRASKRPRVEVNQSETNQVPVDVTNLHLRELLTNQRWEIAMERLKSHPEEAKDEKDPSALALSCRHGAPIECVETILRLCPAHVRRLVGSRGTPLHEAVVCEEIGPEVIDLLLTVDSQLESSSTRRATMMQDVDGHTPLHLLIRRRFQAHMTSETGEGSYLMEILEMLVKSSPEATVVPDCGEYEEPPIVMALKANVYAPSLRPEEGGSGARVEQKIYDMVSCMLQYYPSAASCVFTGHRGKYTALHSAVFHGRCAETIELLLEAEQGSPSEEGAALLANTQGEMPLHFCAMRGEPPRSVALIAAAAPAAVSKRDSSGLTPLHWLWIRFVSSLLSIDEGGRGGAENIQLERRDNEASELSDYVAFATLVRGDFEQDLALVRRLDPSVNFLQMRHIPKEIVEADEALERAERTFEILNRVRERYNSRETDRNGMFVLSRVEAVASLFWTKLVSMLESSWMASREQDGGPFSLVRAAFACTCCPPPVVSIIASMYPNEMSLPDSHGRLALHHAAMRQWHGWDWPRQDGTHDNDNAKMLQLESAMFLKSAMLLSPPEAAKTKDDQGNLPIHYAIRTFIQACCSSGRTYSPTPVAEIEELLSLFVQLHPDSLSEPDPETGLFPFLFAAAKATQTKEGCGSRTTSSFPDELSTTIVYQLLRENPALVGSTYLEASST